MGPAGAKRVGISACRGELVLSMDCDVRPSPRWLAAAAPRALDPSVGLVGSPVLAAGDDVVSRYARRFGTYVPEGGEVGLVSGEIWLMRREVWELTGGFEGFTGRTHEDYFFSRRVAGAGLALELVESPPVFSVRRLSRTDYVRRHVSYTAGLSSAYVRRAGRCALEPLVRATGDRLAGILAEGDAALGYVEFLKFTAFVLAMISSGLGFESGPGIERHRFAAGLFEALALMPGTRTLLERDLAAIDLPLPASSLNDSFWPEVFQDMLDRAGEAFEMIESEGVRLVMDDELNRDYDFHYLRAAGG